MEKKDIFYYLVRKDKFTAMAPFDNHPHHIRRKIAMLFTAGIAVILIVLLVIIYTGNTTPDSNTNDSKSKIINFYNTILTSGQSYFSGN